MRGERPHRWLWLADVCSGDDDSPFWAATRHVACELAQAASNNTSCNPGRRRLMKRTRRSAATIQKALETLEAAGYLRVERIGGEHPNVYHLTIPGSTENHPQPSRKADGGLPREPPPGSAREPQDIRTKNVHGGEGALTRAREREAPATDAPCISRGHSAADPRAWCQDCQAAGWVEA